MTLQRRSASLPVAVLSALLAAGLSGCKQANLSPAAAPAPDSTLTRTISSLQVYPNFADVNSPVALQDGEFTLPGEADPLLLTDTVNLEGVNVLSRTLTGNDGWLGSLEGQGMTLYVDGAPKPVTLVRARDLLVRDWNGKYRRVDEANLAFNEPPPLANDEKTQTLSFQTDGGSGQATLTYLTRGFGWSPHYTLNLQGDKATLSALADIRNPGDQAYNVQATELISGDVNVYGESMAQAQDTAATAIRPVPMPSAGRTSSTSNVRPIGELRGLHRFKLDKPFTLAARSTTSLPFLTPQVTPERLNTMQTYFSAGSSQGAAYRRYRLKADAYLPAGNVLIRDEGHVIGQENIPATAAQQPITLNVGDDPELTFTRTARVLERDKTGAKYQVTFTLKNAKTTPARVRVIENLNGLYGRVIQLTGDAVRDGNNATFATELPARQSVTRTFTLDARIQTKSAP